MEKILNYIWNNKEWIFSGIGVAVVTTVFLLWRSKKSYSVTQKQKGGHGSVNIQIGRDMKPKSKQDKENER